MTTRSNPVRRKSIRLPEYDYSSVGAYFITMVAHDRANIFGEIVDGEMFSNNAGRMGEYRWAELPIRFPSIASDVLNRMY
jgi:putative transposase